jgi:hypothetical protein
MRARCTARRARRRRGALRPCRTLGSGLAQRGVDQRVRHPQRGAFDLAVGDAPDVLEHDVGLDAVDDRQCAVQPVAHSRRQRRGQRRDGVAQDAHAVAAAVGFLLQQPGTFQRPLLQRQLRGSAQLRLEFLEARERLHEQLVHTRAAVGVVAGQGAHGAQRAVDDRGDQRAAAGEVAVGRRARDLGPHRDLGHRRDVAGLADDVHRGVQQQPEGGRTNAALGGRRRFAELVLQARHLSGSTALRATREA